MADKIDPAYEAALTAHRIQELAEKPIRGNFDAAHLTETHRRIFQDIPSYRPGQQRTNDTEKNRSLENGRRYIVRYAPGDDLPKKIDAVLKDFPKPSELKSLDTNAATAKLSKLYADLDYLHPFDEGNSRTLRQFTGQIAAEAGFNLDWSKTGTDEKARDQLYIARDKETFSRAFPGLNQQRADTTNDIVEYEGYERFMKPYAQAKTLEVVMGDMVRKQADLDAAAAFKEGRAAKSLANFPHLAGAYAAMDAMSREVAQSSLSADQQRKVLDMNKARLVEDIERGKIPPVAVKEQGRGASQAERSPEPSPSRKQNLER